MSSLKAQIQELTEQVAVLTTQKNSKKQLQCFHCKQAGHIQRYCPNRVRERRCYVCGRLGHIAANYWHSGNEKRDAPEGQRTSQVSKSPTDTIVVAATKINTAVIMGSIGQHNLEIMMDSGSSISLLAQAYVEQMINITEKPLPKMLLRTASGIPLSIVKYVTASVLIQDMQRMLQQDFFVVSDLIVPAILGLDFLQQHGLVLGFLQ